MDSSPVDSEAVDSMTFDTTIADTAVADTVTTDDADAADTTISDTAVEDADTADSTTEDSDLPDVPADSAPLPVAEVAAYVNARSFAATYTADPLYAYNSSTSVITITRSGAGTYAVTFDGLTLGSGNVQVTSQTQTIPCNVTGVSGSTVEVACRTLGGTPSDIQYMLSVVQNDVVTDAHPVAYAVADDATASSYTPGSATSYNAGGGAITATHTATGTYSMTFAGLDIGKATVHVSAYGSSASCAAHGRTGSTVEVQCASAGSALIDSKYTVTVYRAGTASAAKTVAYALANDPTSASYALGPSHSFNSTGGSVTATRTAAGSYAVTFAGLSVSGGSVKVTSYGSDKRCTVHSWTSNTVSVRCYGGTGALTDSGYTLLWTK